MMTVITCGVDVLPPIALAGSRSNTLALQAIFFTQGS
jgi:hypothetical protein